MIVGLALVRNAIGEEAYVPDEVVKGRSGKRVRFNNTDAEGRLVLADPLTFMKEQIISKQLPNPHIFTFGTMSWHARMSHGDGYAVIVDNREASKEDNALRMQAIGTSYGEPFEVSSLRSEDFAKNRGRVMMEDLIQSDCCTNVATMRGHQV